jgi:pyrroloquinoline quinone biosynthesis protein B
MKALVLGAAAGGGFPQWNSNAAACNRARAGDAAAPARTQASLAVSADGQHWFLLNASPDLRQQIEATPELRPREGLRSTPISGVVLTGGDVDAIAGLLTLRERQPLTVYATAKVQGILKANPIFEVLAHDVVARRTLLLDCPFELCPAASRSNSSRCPERCRCISRNARAPRRSYWGRTRSAWQSPMRARDSSIYPAAP